MKRQVGLDVVIDYDVVFQQRINKRTSFRILYGIWKERSVAGELAENS